LSNFTNIDAGKVKFELTEGGTFLVHV